MTSSKPSSSTETTEVVGSKPTRWSLLRRAAATVLAFAVIGLATAAPAQARVIQQQGAVGLSVPGHVNCYYYNYRGQLLVKSLPPIVTAYNRYYGTGDDWQRVRFRAVCTAPSTGRRSGTPPGAGSYGRATRSRPPPNGTATHGTSGTTTRRSQSQRRSSSETAQPAGTRAWLPTCRTATTITKKIRWRVCPRTVV